MKPLCRSQVLQRRAIFLGQNYPKLPHLEPIINTIEGSGLESPFLPFDSLLLVACAALETVSFCNLQIEKEPRVGKHIHPSTCIMQITRKQSSETSRLFWEGNTGRLLEMSVLFFCLPLFLYTYTSSFILYHFQYPDAALYVQQRCVLPFACSPLADRCEVRAKTRSPLTGLKGDSTSALIPSSSEIYPTNAPRAFPIGKASN